MDVNLSRRALALAATAGLIACASGARLGGDTHLREILALNTRARGGANALAGVRTVRSSGVITEPAFTVTGAYLASTDGYARVDVYHQGAHVFSEGIDAAGCWTRPDVSQQAIPGSERGEAALRHAREFNLYSLEALADRGHSISLSPPEVIDGVTNDVLLVRLSDGFETKRYIDRSTWQVVRSRDVRPLHVDVDATAREIESIFSDFREFQGVRSATSWIERDMNSGDILVRGVTQGVRYNEDAPAERFDRAAPPVAPIDA